MGSRQIYEGRFKSVVAFVRADGSCPALDYLESRPNKDRKSVMTYAERLADFGVIRDSRKFKQIEGTTFFEFKVFQTRVICIMTKDRKVVMLCGVTKKRERFNSSELNSAERLRAEWFYQEGDRT